MIYNSLSYRALLRDQASRMKKEHPARTLKWLAEKAGIQAPYLTNVLKERAHLSSDQLYSIAQLFEWDDEHTGYLFLLHEWERSGHPKRKQDLRKRIDQIRKDKLQSKAHLKQQVIEQPPEEYSRFYLNPFYAILHAFMAIPRFSKRPARVGRCLSLDGRQIQELIRDLVSMNFLVAGEQGYAKTKKNFHLTKESPLCDPHQTLMYQTASQHLQSLPADEKYTFTAMLAADPDSREKIQREFMNFLKAIEPVVKAAPIEELYGMRFDLFRWSFEKEAPGAD